MAVLRLLRRALALYLLATHRSRLVLPMTLALLAALLLTVTGAFLPRTAAENKYTPTQTAHRPSPPSREPRVEQYLAGLIAFDAQQMWDSYSENSLAALRARGITPDELQRRLEGRRQAGIRFHDLAHVGTVPLVDGRKYVFYILTYEYPGQTDIREDYMVFIVGRDGKIESVE